VVLPDSSNWVEGILDAYGKCLKAIAV